MTRKAYPDGNEVTVTYHHAHLPKTITNASGTIEVSYDSRDFPVRVDYPNGQWLDRKSVV